MRGQDALLHELSGKAVGGYLPTCLLQLVSLPGPALPPTAPLRHRCLTHPAAPLAFCCAGADEAAAPLQRSRVPGWAKGTIRLPQIDTIPGPNGLRTGALALVACPQARRRLARATCWRALLKPVPPAPLPTGSRHPWEQDLRAAGSPGWPAAHRHLPVLPCTGTLCAEGLPGRSPQPGVRAWLAPAHGPRDRLLRVP